MKRLGHITSGIVRDLRRRRNIDRLCREWPRAMVELIDEVGAKSGRMTTIEQRLDECVRLLDDVVDAAGGGCGGVGADPAVVGSIVVIERREL